jgi:hypothetical protein
LAVNPVANPVFPPVPTSQWGTPWLLKTKPWVTIAPTK